MSSSHLFKKVAYRTNFSSVREMLIACKEAAGQLYSRGVIGPDDRDSKDPDMIAASVERCLQINERTWDDLMDVIESTHMTALAKNMKRQLEEYEMNAQFMDLSINRPKTSDKPQTAPQMPSLPHTHSTRVRPSTSSVVCPTYVLTLSPNDSAYFRSAPPTTLPLKGTYKQVDSGFMSGLENYAEYPDSYFPPPTTSSPILRPETSEWSLPDEPRYQGSLPESLDLDVTQSVPVPAHSDPRNEDETMSEIVQPQATCKREKKMSESRRLGGSFDIQKLINENATLTAEIEALQKKRKADQELLSMKTEQLAKENQVLNHKILEIQDLESSLLKLKGVHRSVCNERDYLVRQAQALRESLTMAERNTHLSAIRLDSLNDDVSKLEAELKLSKEAVKQWEEWYEQVYSDSNYPCLYSSTS